MLKVVFCNRLFENKIKIRLKFQIIKKGSLSSMVGCQPWALEVVGSNPADPILMNKDQIKTNE